MAVQGATATTGTGTGATTATATPPTLGDETTGTTGTLSTVDDATTGTTGTMTTVDDETTGTTGTLTPSDHAAGAISPTARTIDDLNRTVAELYTDVGVIKLRFYPSAAPNHVRNFVQLAQSGFYNGTKFHRIIPGFMIQGGDPNSIAGNPSTWGTGGSAATLRQEFNGISHRRGILSMARSADPDSASSQFFICVADAPFLDNKYTVFGSVIDGMNLVDAIANAPRDHNDRPLAPISIRRIVLRVP